MSALIFFIFLFANEKIGTNFFVHIPLGPVPVYLFYWSFILFYTVLFYRKNQPQSGITIAKKTIFLGLMAQWFILLSSLEIKIMTEKYIFESNIYGLYLNLLSFASVIVLSIFASRSFLKFDRYASGPIIGTFFFVLFGYLKAGFIIMVLSGISIFLICIPIFKHNFLKGLKNILDLARSMFSNEKLIIFVIFISALIIRTLYLLRIISDPNYLQTGADGLFYDHMATLFANGMPTKEAYSAGYWMFLGVLYKIFGRNYFATCFVQACIGSLGCVIIYYIAKTAFNKKGIAIIAGFIASINYSLIFSTVSLGHQALDIILLPAAVYFLLWYLKKEERHFLLLSFGTILAGLSVVSRELNLLPAFFLLFTVFLKSKNKIKIFIVTALFFSAALAPFAYRNIINLGTIYPVQRTESIGGKAFPASDIFETSVQNQELVAMGIKPLSDPKGTLRVFLNSPYRTAVIVLKTWWRAFLDLYFSQGYGKFDLFFLVRNSIFFYTFWFYAAVITITGIIYLLFFPTDYKWVSILLFGIIVFKTIPHIFMSSRFGFRAPIDPFLIIFFSFAFGRLISVKKYGNKSF